MASRQFRSDDTSTWNERFGDGSDGAYAPSTSTDAPIDSACTGTSATTSLSATNASFTSGQLLLIHQTRGTGAGAWELNKIASYTAGTITTSYPLTNTYSSGAQVLVLKQYSSGLIDTGVTITGKAWTGSVGGIFALLCNETASVVGSLTVANKGYLKGNGVANFNSQANQGDGTSGAGGASSSANGNGGGGASKGGGAGGGGHVSSGGSGAGAGGAIAGAGGGTAGVANLTIMVFGGGGGGAAQDTTAYNGGSGGGIIIIIAKTITFTGTLDLKGDTGQNDTANNSVRGSGAPGAGGSALFKGQTIILGSNKVDASGRTGLTGSGGGTANNKAGDSSAGRIHADYFKSISGTTSPTLDSSQDSIFADIGGLLLLGDI